MDKKLLDQELKILSDDQRKAVDSGKNYLRIVAGAGAGKTTTMAMRIVKVLSEGEKPENIVAFTFTERAAQNMKNRIYEKIRKIHPELCNHLGEMFIGTIHAFCSQILEDHFGFGNYDVLDENQEIAFVMRRGWDLGLGGKGYLKNCANFLKTVDVVYDETLSEEIVKDKVPEFYHKFQKYTQILDEERLLTFSRIIQLAVKNLKKNNKPISHIKHLIVDEYQDINKAQQELVEILGKNASVYIVGDPRQCIYQWRGSNGEHFDEFVQKFKGADKITLHENRRSCINIVVNSNKFAKTLKGNYDDMKTIRNKEGIILKLECSKPEKEAEHIADEIKRIVEKEKKCNYSDVAILLRSVKTSAGPFIKQFKSKDIPYLVGGKIGLFKRDEAQIVARLFVWLHKDGFWLNDSYNWNDQDKGDGLLQSAKSLWEGLFPGKKLSEKLLIDWKEQALVGSYRGLTEAYQELLLILGFLELNPEDKFHAAIMANLGRFNNLLTDYQSSAIRRGRRFRWDADIKGLVWFMNSYAIEAYEEQPAEDIRGIEAVQILTIHQAKGLEWLVVFMPSLVWNRFPSRNMGKMQEWMIPRDLFPVERYEGSEDDERKLFYVAMTRARDFLCLSWFSKMNNYVSKSPFVKDVDGQLLTEQKPFPDLNLQYLEPEDEIQTYTGGEILEYKRCNYFYRLRHLWNYQSEFSPMLGFGKSLHHCLRVASEAVQHQKKEPEEAIEEVFEKGEFHLPFAGITAKDLAERNAKKTLKNYAIKFKQDMKNIQEVEARLEFPLENATIAGRVDVIMNDKGNLEVRDYKTSFEVTSLDEASLQVQLYSLGLSLTKQQIYKATVVALKEEEGKSQIHKVDITKKDLDEARQKAKQAIEGIKNGVWKTRVGKHCKECDYRKICKYTNIPRKTVVKLN